jgi:hypothetical protein
LAARAAGTPFDPRSLDLPSIGALVGFYHACLGFPVKQTWLDSIKASNCDTFEGLTYSNAAKYCLDADETIMGHLAQQHQNVRSTKPKQPTPVPLVVLPTPAATASNQVFIVTQPLNKLFTNDTGRIPVRARSGNQYVMIAIHTDANLIIQQAFKTKSDHHRILVAYNLIMTRLTTRGLSVDLQILDNKASLAYKEAITLKRNVKFQLVPPDMHHRNWAECAIRTFKDHFLAILAGVDAAFPPYLWDLLLPQAELTLNLLRQSTLNPRISAWEFFQGPFDFNKTPLGPVGCRVLIHAKPATRRSWDFCAKNGFYIGPAMDSYRCFKRINLDTKSQVISDTVEFRHSYLSIPTPSTEDRIIRGLHRLSPVPSLVRRCPQASPRSKPLPTSETSSNHGGYSHLHHSSHLESRCRVVQGCPRRYLQGGYRLHQQHRSARFYLAHRGVHRPGHQGLQFYHLLLSKRHSKLLPDKLTSPAPLLQGWDFASDDIANPAAKSPCTRAHCPSHPLPGAGTDPTCTLHRRKAPCVTYQMPTAKTIQSPVEPIGFAGLCRAIPPTEVSGFAGLCQALSLLDLPEALSVLDPSTGEFLKYCQLRQDPCYKATWDTSYANELGRLCQGIGSGTTPNSKRVAGTNTFFIIDYHDIPAHKRNEICHTMVVCEVQPDKDDPAHTRITIGGNRICFPEDVGTNTASLELFKLLLNSVLSRKGARFSTIDLKNVYLDTPMPDPEYVRIKITDIPAEFIEEYKLADRDRDGWINFKIRQGCYGLPGRHSGQ